MVAEAKGFEEISLRENQAMRQPPTPEETGIYPVSAQAQAVLEAPKRIITEFSLPERVIFENFYNELKCFNQLSSELKGDSLILKTRTNFIEMNVRTLIEMLASVTNAPIYSSSDFKNPPPFVDGMKEICASRVSWMLCEFQKIFELNDPRIEKLCQDYHQALSYPILIRLAYTDWENRQMGYKINLVTKRIEEQASAKIRQIQKDYEEKKDKETTILKTQMSRVIANNKGLMTQLSFLDERYSNLKMTSDNQKGEVEEAHKRLKDAENSASEFEHQLIALKKENQAMQQKLDKQKSNEAWVKDITYTQELPVYRNKASGDVLTFPASLETFRKGYKLIKQEDGHCIYENDAGTQFKLPESLADELAGVGAETNGNKQKNISNDTAEAEYEEAIKGKPNLKLIFEFIRTSDIPATQAEIGEALDVDSKNMKKRYLTDLIKWGKIKEVKDGRELRYTLPP